MASTALVRRKSSSGAPASGKHATADMRRQLLKGNARRLRPGEAESDNSLGSSVEPPCGFDVSSPKSRGTSLSQAVESQAVERRSEHGKPEAMQRQGFSPSSRSVPDGNCKQRRSVGNLSDAACASSPKQRGRVWCTASASGSQSAALRHNSAPAGSQPVSSRALVTAALPSPRGKFVPWAETSSHKSGALETAKWKFDSRLSISSCVSRGSSNVNAAKRCSGPVAGAASARQSRSAPVSPPGDASPVKAAGARRRRRGIGQSFDLSQDLASMPSASSTSPTNGQPFSDLKELRNAGQHEGCVSSKVPPLQLGQALRKTGSCSGTPSIAAVDDESEVQTLLGDATPRSSMTNGVHSGEGLHESAKLKSIQRVAPGQMPPMPAVSKELLQGQEAPQMQGRSPNRHGKGGAWSPGGIGSVDGDSTTTGGFEPETPQSCACNDAHTLPPSSSPRPRGASPGMVSSGLDFEQDRRAMIMQWSSEQANTISDTNQRVSKISKSGTPSRCLDEHLSCEELSPDRGPMMASDSVPNIQDGDGNATAEAYQELVSSSMTATSFAGAAAGLLEPAEMNESLLHAPPATGAADAPLDLSDELPQDSSFSPVDCYVNARESCDEVPGDVLSASPRRGQTSGQPPNVSSICDESDPARLAQEAPSLSSPSLQAAGFPSSAVKRRQGDYYSIRTKAAPTFDGGAAGLPVTYAARRALDEAAADAALLSELGSMAGSSIRGARAQSTGSLKHSGQDSPPNSKCLSSPASSSCKFEGAAGLPNSYASRRALEERNEHPQRGAMMSGRAVAALLGSPISDAASPRKRQEILEPTPGATSSLACRNPERTNGPVACSQDATRGFSPAVDVQTGSGPADESQSASWHCHVADACADGAAAGRPSGGHDPESATEGRTVASLLSYNSNTGGVEVEVSSDIKSTNMRRTREDYTGGGPTMLRGAIPVASPRICTGGDELLSRRHQSPRASEYSPSRVGPGESSTWPVSNESCKPFTPQGSVAGQQVKSKNLLDCMQVTATPPSQDFLSEHGSDTPTRHRYTLDVLSSAWGHNAKRLEWYPDPDIEMKRRLGNKMKSCQGLSDWKEFAAGNFARPPMSARGIFCTSEDWTQDDAEGWAIPCVTGESLREAEEESPLCIMRRKKDGTPQTPSESSQRAARFQPVMRYDSRGCSEPPPLRSSWNPLTQESLRDQDWDSSRAGRPSHAPVLGTQQWSKQRHVELSGSQMAGVITNSGLHQAAQETADRWSQDPAFADQCQTMHRLKAEQAQAAASIKEKMEPSATGVASMLRWE